MAKIIKVGSQNPTFTSQKTKKSTSIQTHRNSNEATNPFKFTNFEGNTLQFADVFEGFTPKSSSKLRIIASSAAGTMNKIKTGFESIVNFVNRVREGFNTRLNNTIEYAKNAWDYAYKTDIKDVPAIKAVTSHIYMPDIKAHVPSFRGLSDSMAKVGTGITSHIETINSDIVGLTKGLSEKWTNMVSKLQPKRINADMPVAELEQLWRNEIELGGAV